MSVLLHLESSIFGGHGQSSQLSQKFVDHWKHRHPDGRVIARDIVNEPIPHLTGDIFSSFSANEDDMSNQQKTDRTLSDTLIDELEQSDVLVIGLPLYNFGIPSQLKAWFDQIARAGKSFHYSENGPVGHMTGKKAYIFAARGGVYAGTENDFQTGYLKMILGFIGITDVEFIYAEGLATGDEGRDRALQSAHERIDLLAAA